MFCISGITEAASLGSGLGLYIVKYIVEKMGGKVLLQNHKDGLEVKLILPVKMQAT